MLLVFTSIGEKTGFMILSQPPERWLRSSAQGLWLLTDGCWQPYNDARALSLRRSSFPVERVLWQTHVYDTQSQQLSECPSTDSTLAGLHSHFRSHSTSCSGLGSTMHHDRSRSKQNEHMSVFRVLLNAVYIADTVRPECRT